MNCRSAWLLCVVIAVVGCSKGGPGNGPTPTSTSGVDQQAVLSAENAVVRFEVLGAKLDLMEMVFQDGRRAKLRASPGPADAPYLLIEFRITNLSTSKRIVHSRAENSDFDRSRDPALFEDLGHECTNVTSQTSYAESFGDGKIVGRNRGVIEPGKSMTDVLLFNAPAKDAKLLTLGVPVLPFDEGSQEQFTLKIPTTMITTAANPAVAQ